jgi:hypothetical protein
VREDPGEDRIQPVCSCNDDERFELIMFKHLEAVVSQNAGFAERNACYMHLGFVEQIESIKRHSDCAKSANNQIISQRYAGIK